MRVPYKRQKINTGDLRTPIQFYEYAPNDGPEAGEVELRELFKSWAKIDEVWMKDVELAKTNGTLSDITLTIRDPLGDYFPNDTHYFAVEARGYSGKRYNIQQVFHDPQNSKFIKIIGSVSI